MTCGCSISCTACGKVGTDSQRIACTCPPGECKCDGCANNVAKHSGCTCGDSCECPAGACNFGSASTAGESNQAPVRTQDCQCKGECKCATTTSRTCDCGGSTEKVRTSGCRCGPKCACADACNCAAGEAKAAAALAAA